ncbi:MAG TPA: hypothetical protein VJ816_03600 [Gemmatimonadales bacterium]|nr:hypothetical protein [Gemmatimonadales bacterium]
MTRPSLVRWGTLLGLLAPAALAAQQPTARNPHGALTQPCAACHSPEAWSPARISTAFDHAKAANYPLLGVHATVACKACHTALTFKQAPRDCVGCHTDPHRGELGTSCGRCHTQRSFVDRTEMGRAHQLTRFPLTGAHVAVDCESCHTGAGQGQMTFVARPTDCNSCHSRDYQATRNPDHAASGFPRDCQACHATTAWSGGRFDHNASRFPLTGAHVAVTCTQCHGTGGFGALPTACVSCHQADYNGANNPSHQQAQFPTDCTRCHTTASWNGANFNHSATSFPLTGAHVQLTCDQCHGDGVYNGKPTTCVACHQADFNRTTTPNHSQAQFPTDCTVCHTTTTWNGASFNHSSTAFALTGAHIPLSCDQCHGDGVYRGKPTACVSCHQTDYNNAVDPNHQQAQFTTDCASCHTTTVWTSATFTNHDAQYFPIYSGAHRGRWTSCSTCHVNPSDYRQFDCLSCHSAGQTTPHHSGVSGYSYDSPSCYRCHPRGSH